MTGPALQPTRWRPGDTQEGALASELGSQQATALHSSLGSSVQHSSMHSPACSAGASSAAQLLLLLADVRCGRQVSCAGSGHRAAWKDTAGEAVSQAGAQGTGAGDEGWFEGQCHKGRPAQEQLLVKLVSMLYCLILFSCDMDWAVHLAASRCPAHT